MILRLQTPVIFNAVLCLLHRCNHRQSLWNLMYCTVHVEYLINDTIVISRATGYLKAIISSRSDLRTQEHLIHVSLLSSQPFHCIRHRIQLETKILGYFRNAESLSLVLAIFVRLSHLTNLHLSCLCYIYKHVIVQHWNRGVSQESPRKRCDLLHLPVMFLSAVGEKWQNLSARCSLTTAA